MDCNERVDRRSLNGNRNNEMCRSPFQRPQQQVMGQNFQTNAFTGSDRTRVERRSLNGNAASGFRQCSQNINNRPLQRKFPQQDRSFFRRTWNPPFFIRPNYWFSNKNSQNNWARHSFSLNGLFHNNSHQIFTKISKIACASMFCAGVVFASTDLVIASIFAGFLALVSHMTEPHYHRHGQTNF